MLGEDHFELRTKRLLLRPLVLEDWPAVQRIGGHPSVAPMLASTRTPWPKAAVQAWITERRYRGTPGFCAAIVMASAGCDRCGRAWSKLGAHPLQLRLFH